MTEIIELNAHFMTTDSGKVRYYTLYDLDNIVVLQGQTQHSPKGGMQSTLEIDVNGYLKMDRVWNKWRNIVYAHLCMRWQGLCTHSECPRIKINKVEVC